MGVKTHLWCLAQISRVCCQPHSDSIPILSKDPGVEGVGGGEEGEKHKVPLL